MEEHTPRDDDELVDGILRGSEAAFRLMVESYHGRVFRLVYGIINDWQLAEDVSQEVFVSVFLKLSSFRRDSKFSTWLYRVAVNAALKARRRAKRHGGNSPLEESFGMEGDSDDGSKSLASEEVLSKLLTPLPDHLRAVVLLKEKEGLSYREMAEVLGCSTGAVEQRIHRAFERLRTIWKDRPDELGVETS